MASLLDFIDSIYVKSDGHLETIKRTELTSNSTTILIHTEKETAFVELHKCPSESF